MNLNNNLLQSLPDPDNSALLEVSLKKETYYKYQRQLDHIYQVQQRYLGMFSKRPKQGARRRGYPNPKQLMFFMFLSLA